jgi:penicillin V acylase-like amidase (Ntn superfamily)
MIQFRTKQIADRRVSAMTNNATYEEQITKLWAYYNLHGDLPDVRELAEMVGSDNQDEKKTA